MSVKLIGRYNPGGMLRVRRALFPPVFSVLPSITSTETFTDSTYTANLGSFAPSKSVPTYRWLLNGVAVGTGNTVVPNAVGSLVLEVTLTNKAGTLVKTTTAVSVTTRAPAFTTQPSITPTNAQMGTTFTGNKGVVINASTYTYQWYLNGNKINGQTASTYVSDGIGSLTFQVTATGPTGLKVVATSPAVTITSSPVVQNAPTWTVQPGLLGTFAEGSSVSLPLMASDKENNIATYGITGGQLPNGLSIDMFSGVISGTLGEVIADTSYTFEVTVTDRTNLTLKGNFTINVANVKTTVTWQTPNDQPVGDTAPGQPVNINLGASSS